MKAANKVMTRHTREYLCYLTFKSCEYLWFKDGLVHNDLKLDNMLISDCLRSLQLCDFGHTTRFGEELSHKVGTLRYRAPEANYWERYSSDKNEAFSFGVMIFILFF